ncbi:MAG: PKD repeat protein [Vicingaceae bacterium]|jgi:PKD repeat protein
MKKILFGLSVFFTFNSYSQISITIANMPVSGDTLRFSTALLDTSVLLNYQNNGANQIWNFDSLRVISQGVQRFISSTQTPYSSVPTNRIGLLFADTISLGGSSVNDVYNFITSSSTDFSIDYRAVSVPTGFALFPVLRIQDPYVDKDEVFQFPLDFGDRDSSTFDFVFNNSLLGVYYGSSGYRINEVDAWGTITTPYGTFNTLRVITDMVSLDTVGFSGQNIAIPSHVRTYQWISNGERVPVMTVNGLVIAGTFVPNSVEFRDSVRIVEPLLPALALFIADTTSVEVNDDLDFNNLSLGSTSFQWDFTPNTVTYKSGSSTSRNITVSFKDIGKYSVRLISMGGSRSDTLTRTDYITVIPGFPTADFIVENDSAVSNVNFTILNKSAYGTTFEWKFIPDSVEYRMGTNDASKDSIVVRFTNKGFYSIELEATNNVGSRALIKTNAVFVQYPVGITELNPELNNKITLAPNPVEHGSTLLLKVENSILLRGYEVYTIDGKLVEEVDLKNRQNLSVFTPQVAGIYFYKILTEQGTTTKKLIVE